jgi:D-amino-acid dehydrogenase
VRVLIVGSGLIGVTSAYFLRALGHDVTVIDQADGPGEATSFANGGLITPSMPEPWNAPGSWRVLLASLWRTDSPMQLHLRTLPGLAKWGIEFFRNSGRASFERNTLHNLRLALYSLNALEPLREQTGIDYYWRKRGTLRVFRDAASLRNAAGAANRLAVAGLNFRTLSPSQTVALEPALEPIQELLAGALHYGEDETGDAYRFCVGLAERARDQGVNFRFGTQATSIEVKSGQVRALWCGPERLQADGYVVAAGSYSAVLLNRKGLRLPVSPAKGYSLTYATPNGAPLLSVPIVDDQWHAAVVPLEGSIRIAGTAEFAGFDLTLNPARVRNLQALLTRVLPQARLDSMTAKAWCGLRPMSADGVPIIGPTSIPNLWLNTGHGHLGWTLAVGSGQLLADLVSGRRPGVDPAPYALGRFS